MNIYINPINPEAAKEVAFNLLPDDRREMEEGYGLTSQQIITNALKSSSTVFFLMPNRKIAAMGGIERGGKIWMLCTPNIYESPILFVRVIKKYMQKSSEKILWNFVDERNETHLKLLKFLGFKFLNKVRFGPNNLTFIKFCLFN